MNTVAGRPTRRQRKPAAPKPLTWEWLMRPVRGRGYLRINDTLYQVTEQESEYESGWGGRLWDLEKPDGTTYRLVIDRDDTLTCDCPDAVYREHEHTCKHGLCVREAYLALEMEQAR